MVWSSSRRLRCNFAPDCLHKQFQNFAAEQRLKFKGMTEEDPPEEAAGVVTTAISSFPFDEV